MIFISLFSFPFILRLCVLSVSCENGLNKNDLCSDAQEKGGVGRGRAQTLHTLVFMVVFKASAVFAKNKVFFRKESSVECHRMSELLN